MKIALLCISLLLIHKNLHADTREKKLFEWETNFSLEGASTTLPVLVIGKPKWPNFYTPNDKYAHAWQSGRFDLGVKTSADWQIGYLARYEASLHANSNTVDVAALLEKGEDPKNEQKFNIDYKSKNWSGHGINIVTPWLNVDNNKDLKYKAGFQLLYLKRFNTSNASGWINYTSDNIYDFNVFANQNSYKNTSQFSEKPSANGWGTSLSLAMRYDYDTGSHIEFQGDDLISYLNWRLLNEQSSLNSKQKITFADGSVDFTTMISGKYQSIKATERMDPNIRLRWGKSITTETSLLGKGQLVFDYRYRSNVKQSWVGWASENYHDIIFNNKNFQYKISGDVFNKAIRMEMRYHNAFMVLGGDRLGPEAKQKVFQLGWRTYY